MELLFDIYISIFSDLTENFKLYDLSSELAILNVLQFCKSGAGFESKLNKIILLIKKKKKKIYKKTILYFTNSYISNIFFKKYNFEFQ